MNERTWYFYDRATGLLSGASFNGPADALEQQLGHLAPGVGAFEGDADYLCQKVDVQSGLLVDHKPEPPWDGTDLTLYVWWWDRAAKRWKLRPRLKNLKADKWAEAKAARQAAIDAPLVTAYGVFDHDEGSRTAIARSAQACAATGKGIDYTLADNTVVQLTAAQMTEVWAASHERLQVVRAQAEALRAVKSAMTAGAV